MNSHFYKPISIRAIINIEDLCHGPISSNRFVFVQKVHNNKHERFFTSSRIARKRTIKCFVLGETRDLIIS
jgi:hypothetical protein